MKQKQWKLLSHHHGCCDDRINPGGLYIRNLRTQRQPQQRTLLPQRK